MATTDSRRVLAFDPGPRECWYARAALGDRGMVIFVDAGMVHSSDDAGIASLMTSATEEPRALVAVEVPSALHPRAGATPANLFARSKQLMATARAAQRIEDAAHARALDVLELSAGQWRHALVRKNNASNALIKRAVTLFSIGLSKRTNEHQRDALGLAIVALRSAPTARGVVR